MRIKDGFLLLAGLCLLSGCGRTQTEERVETQAFHTSESERVEETEETAERDYSDFFAEDRVHDLYAEIGQSDWDFILENPEEMEYVSVNVSIDGVGVSDVGFRTRGSSSIRTALRRDSDRYPFRLKFDEYVEDQRFLGLDELVLTNGNDDPSYLREYLGYEAYRQIGLDAPLVAFFNLYINGELHGLYIGVEAIDNRYLERVFDEHGGNLYEADLQATLEPEMELSLLEQKKGGGESKEDISRLIRTLDEMPLGEKGGIESVLDVDSVLQYFAVSAVVHNWDDYAGQFAHNYYLYAHDGLLVMLPWDMNESFLQTQAYYRPSDGAKQDIETPLTGGALPEERPLVQKLLAVPEYYEQYLDYCETLRQWLDGLPQELERLYERIYEDVERDPTSFYSFAEFEEQFDDSYADGLAGFIRERAEYLAERLPQLRDGR